MNLNHFQAAVMFSLCASVVLGVVTKKNDQERFYYGLYTFGSFLFALFAIGWVMKLGHG